MHLGRVFILLAALLLGACSMRSAINSLTSAEDRAFAEEMVAHLRNGDQDWLRQRFDPQLWEESGKQVGSAPELYPSVPGTTEIVSFNVSSEMDGGGTRRSKEFTLVTHGGGRWTVTSFRTFSTGGPDRVVQWSVVPHNSEPPELAMLNGIDAALPWIWATLAIVLLAAVGLIVWLVRRSRRKHDPLQGQPRGTP